jgi:hypothetical protein
MLVCAWPASAAVIDTGTGSTYVYSQDLNSDANGGQIFSDCMWNNLSHLSDAATAWAGNVGNAEARAIILHFQAPAGTTFGTATVFTRSYLRTDHWEDLSLNAYYHTTAQGDPWDYYYGSAESHFYSRDNRGVGSTGLDENTTTLDIAGATDLYLTFVTYQSGYADMNWSKKWFVSTAGVNDPGLIVTLTQVPEPMTMALLAMGGVMAMRRRMA